MLGCAVFDAATQGAIASVGHQGIVHTIMYSMYILSSSADLLAASDSTNSGTAKLVSNAKVEEKQVHETE